MLADDISSVDATADGQPLIFHFYYYRDGDGNAATPPTLDGEYDTRTALTAAQATQITKVEIAFRANRAPRQGHRPRLDRPPQRRSTRASPTRTTSSTPKPVCV